MILHVLAAGGTAAKSEKITAMLLLVKICILHITF
jgi:hypothetical protein